MSKVYDIMLQRYNWMRKLEFMKSILSLELLNGISLIPIGYLIGRLITGGERALISISTILKFSAEFYSSDITILFLKDLVKFVSSVSEFNEFGPGLKSAKNRFQLRAGLNLEKFNTILSETNHI